MSFDNFDNINVNMPKSNLFKLILYTILAFVIFALSIFVPFLGILGLALISIPSIKLMLEGRIWESIICALIGSSFLFFIDWILPLFFSILIIGMSFIYLFCFKKNKNPFLVVILNGILFIILIAIFLIILSIIKRQNILISFMNYYKETINTFPNSPFIKQYMQLMSINETQFNALYEQTKNILLFLPYVIPGLLLVYVFLSSIINYYWSLLIFKKDKIILRGLPLFQTWDLPWGFVSGIILGLILIMIPHFNKYYNFIFNVVGINLLIIFGLIYSILGFSVLWGIFDKFHVLILWRILIIILISFFPILIILIPVIGIIDVWANFRKLERH